VGGRGGVRGEAASGRPDQGKERSGNLGLSLGTKSYAFRMTEVKRPRSQDPTSPGSWPGVEAGRRDSSSLAAGHPVARLRFSARKALGPAGRQGAFVGKGPDPRTTFNAPLPPEESSPDSSGEGPSSSITEAWLWVATSAPTGSARVALSLFRGAPGESCTSPRRAPGRSRSSRPWGKASFLPAPAHRFVSGAKMAVDGLEPLPIEHAPRSAGRGACRPIHSDPFDRSWWRRPSLESLLPPDR